VCERGANRVCVEVPLWLLSLDPPEPPMLGQSDESCTPEPPPGGVPGSVGAAGAVGLGCCVSTPEVSEPFEGAGELSANATDPP
jgi:hypothetical protein